MFPELSEQYLASILQKYLVKAKVQQLLINPLLHSLHQAQHARTLTFTFQQPPWIAAVFKRGDTIFTLLQALFLH